MSDLTSSELLGMGAKDANPCEAVPRHSVDDPWLHRTSGMRCHTCMFCAPKTNYVGRCRRHAPTMSGYPVIFIHTDWCGDHELDENAV